MVRPSFVTAFALVSGLFLLGHCSSSSNSATSSAHEAGPSVPSCNGSGPGVATCGEGGTNCCASPVVTGGAYYRSYDGVSTNGALKDAPATVSDFALDKYEVTVGRFRKFVAATAEGWTPAAGSGKHTHLAGGGLNGGTEPGWDASWSSNVPKTAAAWTTSLSCNGGGVTGETWTPEPGANEDAPANCVSFYEAYAFCIWDGGFLPTEAEWNYASAGGSDQRVYPWTLPYPPGSTTLDCDYADYAANYPGTVCHASGIVAVGSTPRGDGKFGHSDLAGNVFEWTLDAYAPNYSKTCDDCANLSASEYRVIRGGSFDASPSCLLASLRETSVPEGHSTGIGVRCARTP